MKLRWRLSHARGYLELGMIEAASAELDQVSTEDVTRIEVMGMRAAILQEQKRWPALQVVAAELVRRQPDDAAWWVMWAFATRRADSLSNAERILREAETVHPGEPTIQFNLGCYACQQGHLSAARARVDRAIALDDKFREAAATDPDLAPLREAQTDN